jgi:hypothetical protein
LSEFIGRLVIQVPPRQRPSIPHDEQLRLTVMSPDERMIGRSRSIRNMTIERQEGRRDECDGRRIPLIQSRQELFERFNLSGDHQRRVLVRD